MMRRGAVGKSRAILLWAIGALALLQLGLAVAIEYRLPEWRDPFYACRAAMLQRRVTASPRPVTVLVLGSSRVQHGLRGSELGSWASDQIGAPVVVFNFGIRGAGPVANLCHFKRLW